MGKSIKILVFMYLLTKVSFAQIVDPGIFCHRGGNGKFSIDLSNQLLEVENLFSNRKRSRLFESEKESDHQLLNLEGSTLNFTKVMTEQGYLNVRAYDSETKTFVNMNIKQIDSLLNEERSRVGGDVTIFSYDLNPENMFQEYKSSIRCELD